MSACRRCGGTGESNETAACPDCGGQGGFCASCGEPCPSSLCHACERQEAHDEEANREYLSREYERSQEGDWMRRTE